MRISKANVGDCLISKITGLEAVVSDKVSDSILCKTTLGEDVKITSAQEMSWRIIHFAPDTTNYRNIVISLGRLVDDSTTKAICEMGDIKANKILAYMPGRIFFEAEDGVYRYLPRSDRFERILSSTGFKVLYSDDDNLILQKSSFEKDEDGNEFVSNVETYITYREGKAEELNIPIPTSAIPVRKGKKVLGFTFVTDGSKIDRKVDSRIYIAKKGNCVLYRDTITVTPSIVTSATVTAYNNINDVTFKGKDFFFIGRGKIIETPLCEQLPDFLVDVTQKGNETHYTFADIDGNCKCLIAHHSIDRGTRYEIEDNPT